VGEGEIAWVVVAAVPLCVVLVVVGEEVAVESAGGLDGVDVAVRRTMMFSFISGRSSVRPASREGAHSNGLADMLPS
jgi:hypothetical protein